MTIYGQPAAVIIILLVLVLIGHCVKKNRFTDC